jgi:hypothetical protein
MPTLNRSYTLLALLATYIAILPAVTQAKILHSTHAYVFNDYNQRAGPSVTTLLATLVASLLFLINVHAPLTRAIRQAAPEPVLPPAIITPTEIKATVVSNSNKAYVGVLVQNMILKAISKEHQSRIDRSRSMVSSFISALKSKDLIYNINKTKIKALERRLEMANQSKKLDIIERDRHIRELEAEIQVLQHDILNKHKTISNLQATTIVKNAMIKQQKALSSTLAHSILEHHSDLK